MDIRLHPDSPVPIYQQLHDRIIEAIASGQLRNGTQLESVRTVATTFGINPMTVKKAYDMLADEGIIERKERSKAVVALPELPPEEGLGSVRAEMTTLVARGLCMGMSVDGLKGLVDASAAQLGWGRQEQAPW